MSDTEMIWPEELPQSPLLDGWRETLADNMLRTEMEQGPAKLRRRGTAASGRMQLHFLLSPDQGAVLDAFYSDTLQGGVKRFQLPHPRKGDAVLCRFMSPPEYSAVSGGYCRARLSLEVLA
jgi:hypothetical protein